MTSKEALENITNWIEYFTRLDYVEPIVRGEVQQNFYEAYHKTRPELELIRKDLEILEILKPFLKKVLEINEDGTEVFFKAVRYFNGYVVDINGNWNETEQIRKNKILKEWMNNDRRKENI